MCTAKFRGLCNKSCSDKCQRLVFTKDVQICALKAIGRSVNLKIVTIFSLIILGIGDLKAIEACALKYTEFFAPKTVGTYPQVVAGTYKASRSFLSSVGQKIQFFPFRSSLSSLPNTFHFGTGANDDDGKFSVTRKNCQMSVKVAQ